MAYYPPDVVEKAKEIDLLTYLQNNNPNELKKCARGTYQTVTHDSLKISNGMWHWFSRGIGGKTALEYLIQVEEKTFLQAMEILVGASTYVPYKNINAPIKNEIKLKFPIKNEDNAKVIKYLLSRGINIDIIEYCISNELLYQERNTDNVVFVGYDDHDPKYISVRGIKKVRFFKEVGGSNKSYSFKLVSDIHCEELHLFESAIDVLSYATLLKLHGKIYSEYNLLSLAGVYKPASKIEESKVPVALNLFLDNHQEIKKIYLHLDNDEAGRLSSLAIQINLKDKYEVIDSPPKRGKDVNDFLLLHKQKLQNMNKER